MARPFLDFVHPDDREETEREAALITTGDFTASFTNRYPTKDGELALDRVGLEGGHGARADLRLRPRRDRTARSTNGARQEAEERFRRAFEDSAVGMAVVGVEGRERQPDHPGQREPGPHDRHVGRGAGGHAHARRAGRSGGRGAHHRGDVPAARRPHLAVPLRVPDPASRRPAAVGGPDHLARTERGRRGALPPFPGGGHRRPQARRPSSSSTWRTTTRSAASSTGAASSRSSSASSATPRVAAGRAPSSSWTWTTSRTSTTRSATPSATP